MKKIFLPFLIVIFIIAYNNADGQEPVSFGLAPQLEFKPWSIPLDYNYSSGFVYTYNGGSFQLNKQFLINTNLTNIGSPVNFTFPPAAATVNTSTGILYLIGIDSLLTLYSVDTLNGTRTSIVNLTGVPQENLTGITWDQTEGGQLWGVSTNLTVSQIFKIDISTGVCTSIGSASSRCAGAVSISASPGGNLYVIDIVSDSLFKFDKITGAETCIGSLGIDANFSQDAQFDLSDGKLYWASYSTNPELRLIDTLNGASTVIGGYSNAVYTLGIYGKIGSGIDNYDLNDYIHVYPNPSKNVVYINTSYIETINITTITGQQIGDFRIYNDNASIDLSKYYTGIYLLHIKTDKGLFTKKITISN